MKINAKLKQVGSVVKVIGTKSWIIDSKFIFEILFNMKKYETKVGFGFKTDFGSIPRLFWIFFDKTAWMSYILHDMLYTYNGFYDSNGDFIRVSKRQADLLLFYGMKSEGASLLERELVLLGLDIGGWIAWYRKKTIKIS